MGHVSKTTPLLGVICHPFDIVSLCTKFESSSFSHSWDMDGAPKIWNVSRDVTTPLSGTVCCPSAGTSYCQSDGRKDMLCVRSSCVVEQVSEDSGCRRYLPNYQWQHEDDSWAETIAAETATWRTKPPHIQLISVADDAECDFIRSKFTVCIVYCHISLLVLCTGYEAFSELNA